jgi:hypothetical protein
MPGTGPPSGGANHHCPGMGSTSSTTRPGA